MGRILAVDIGGTKLAAGLVDDSGRVLRHRRTPTAGADGEAVFARLAELIGSVLDGETVDAVGVGCGGPMDLAAGEVSPLHIPQWRAFPLRRRLADLVERPVHLDNDAKALALGEGWVGAAVGEHSYLAMVVSTGIGAGVVVDGRLLDGATGNAGHLGHIQVDPGGPPCACGARGCLEAMASGTAVAAATGRPPAEASVEVRRRTGRLVGRAVASAVNLLDLRLAVVGGSVALGFGRPFFDEASAALEEGCGLSFTRGARLVPAGRGAEGPLVGAAAVAVRSRSTTAGGVSA